MPHLLEPLALRGVTLRNRIGMSPMCMYSAQDGAMNDWHLVHYGARAAGGVGLVIVEATAVEARGRISPNDLGIWSDEHVATLTRVADFVRTYGAVPGIQIAHAGRKAGTAPPWLGGKPLSDADGGWTPVAPSAVPFDANHRVPQELSAEEVAHIRQAFVDGARRADTAGFELLEVHGAHGYLMHSFHSPLSNRRSDEYGGAFDNRVRFTLETVGAVRDAWPEKKPLAVRLSSTDWVDGGWTLDETVELARRLKALGIDLVDCSSGGGVAGVTPPSAPGYQVQFAQAVRREAGVATATVGMIRQSMQADQIVRHEQADIVLLGRELLRNPHWPLQAAHELGLDAHGFAPNQYLRGV